MGLSISHGIGIPFQKSGISWSSYWKKQTDTLLFFGQIENISGGRLYNEMTGSSDYLTVGGSAGSWTFQCPNNATYIDADENVDGVSDYIWFKTDETLRTVTEAKLIGYDFTKTIVYYDDVSPYTLRAIAILKPDGSVSNRMRNDFHLSIWWDNTLSAYGNLKGNRGSEQSVWTSELAFTKLLSHFDGTNGIAESSDEIAGAWTFVGTSVLSTGQKKFGTSSLYCNTGKNYVSTPNSANYNFGSGNFTIDCWVFPTTFDSSGGNFICGQSDASATTSSRQSNICIALNTKKLQLFFWDSNGDILASNQGNTTFAINTWYHIAAVRNGNTITGYVNGVPECTIDVTGKTLQASSQKFVVGSLGEYNNTSVNIRGYIDEFRISKGIARWVADFSSSLPSSEYILD